MSRSLQPSIIFSSLTWKAFICAASLPWLFSLVAHNLSGPIHSWYSLFFSFFISFFRLIVPYRYQERAASSGGKEYLKQLTGGSQEPDLPAYVAWQNRVCLNTVGDVQGYIQNRTGQECKSLWSEKSPCVVHFDHSDRHCKGFRLPVKLKPNVLLEISNLFIHLKSFELEHRKHSLTV